MQSNTQSVIQLAGSFEPFNRVIDIGRQSIGLQRHEHLEHVATTGFREHIGREDINRLRRFIRLCDAITDDRPLVDDSDSEIMIHPRQSVARNQGNDSFRRTHSMSYYVRSVCFGVC